MPKPVIVPPFDGTPEDLARALLRDKTTKPEDDRLKKGQPAGGPARRPAGPPKED